jgi:Zn-dependent metalloprotease/subtilisin-like proprotein convertase family protein
MLQDGEKRQTPVPVQPSLEIGTAMKIHTRRRTLAGAAAAAVTVAVAAVFLGTPSSQRAAADLAAGAADAHTDPAAPVASPDTGAVAAGSGQQSARPTGSSAITALRAEADGDVIVRHDRSTAGTSLLRAADGGDLYPQVQNLPPAGKTAAFLERHGAVFGIRDVAEELRMLEIREDQYGHTRVAWQQMYGNLPVFGAVLHGHVNRDGRLTAINGKFVPGINLPTSPVVTQAAAEQAAVNAVGAQQPAAQKNLALSVSSAALVVYRHFLARGTAGATHLAYQVQVTHGTAVREFVYVDAISGKIVDQISGIHGVKDRRIYEATYNPENPELPPPAWREGDLRPAVDPAHEDEVAAGGHTYNLFFNLSDGGHRSWDGNDAQMVTVNNDPTIICPNANWNGTSTNYCSGTSADDVVAHEWTHAYTQETSGLIYQWQSGALNESYSDIFGETVDIINNREGVEGTAAIGNDGPRSQDESVCSEFTSELPTGDQSIRWLLAEDAFAFSPLPPIGDAAIRDMWNPACAGGAAFLGDPGHMSSDNYSCSADDAGGVHTNSAVNNRAYAILVDGNTLEVRDDGTPFSEPVTVEGIGLTKAAHIFWRANSVYNTPATNMAENADSLEMACQDLIGVNLTKLVTDAELGAGVFGNDDTAHPTPESSGEVISAGDCQQVSNAIAAVEMRLDVSKQCGFGPMLDPAPAPRCGNAEVRTYFSENWDSGLPASWSVGQEPLTKSMLDTRVWFVRNGDLPDNPDGSAHSGSAIFQENRRDLGNCTTDDESGVLFLETPPIVVDAEDASHFVFEHYVSTELGYDGGNIMISINGGDFQIVPGSAFEHNAYPGNLNDITDQNTNPKGGEPAFHGANENEVSADWGESQIDLAAAGVQPGDTIVLRWDFGQDGCNGNEGWYVDDVELFTCGEAVEPPTMQCNSYPASGFLPLVGSPIISLASSVTTATVSGETEPVSDVNVRNLTGSHTFMGDLTFSLESPSGTAIRLFDGASCGAEPGIDVEFDDAATTVISCGDWVSGAAFRPQKALNTFNGENANGNWTLTVTDGFPQDEGQLDSWEVEFCTDLENNTPPVAGDDSATTRKNKAITISVLTNDSDADGDCLSITSVTTPGNGTASLNGSGSCDTENPETITYQPKPGFGGMDSFSYQISDGQGGMDTATVEVHVGK